MNFEEIRAFLRKDKRFKEVETEFVKREVSAKALLLKEGQIANIRSYN
ncbi:MAG: hypothetical protein M0R16_13205 [Bacteroidales bacterium]|jgi:hypothetical protein|nr:hypothetical protein [Bacteroidales bacterium]